MSVTITTHTKKKEIIKEVRFDKKTVLVTINCQLFDVLCVFLGNSYKADSWLAMRVSEVGGLPDRTISSYLRLMFRELLSRDKTNYGINPEEGRAQKRSGTPLV